MSGAGDIVVPDWPAPANIHARVTTRTLPGRSKPPFDHCNLGSRCGDAPDAVAANRAALVDALELPAAPRWLQQVHGIEVHDADRDPLANEPEADAAVTRAAGRVLCVLTADCLPVLLCADDGSAVGIAHAGWRGLAGGVIEAAVDRLGVVPASIIAWLGPAIGAPSYEVGDEVRAAFVENDADSADAFVATRPGHWLCDLYALARRRLAAAGVAAVYGGGFDTFADARFYSYRRDRETGRFASLIWIGALPVKADDKDAEPAMITQDFATPVFARVMGDAFATLPPLVRDLHRRRGRHRWRGRAKVLRGRSWLSRLCGWAAGLPRAAEETPIDVEIAASSTRETWTRYFGARAMRSDLWPDGALLRERLGIVTFAFALSAREGRLVWSVREASVFGLKLPLRWFDGVSACETGVDGRYRFEAKARFPLAGDVVHYEGWLAAADG